MSPEEFFSSRENGTAQKLQQLSASFERHLGEDGKEALAGGCLYAVGSAGRGELGASSDLDVFIVSEDRPTRIRETLVAAAVIRTMREHQLPEPSNDALFLRLYAADDLEQRLGHVSDDAENTFTARMLLLLESRPLFGADSYTRLLDRVLKAYWLNTDRHTDDYLPIVLVNDIVRYWRVVLLNYEARFARKMREAAGDSEQLEKIASAKRFASYKLRFSRSMTCYSMIARLLVETSKPDCGKQHVSMESTLRMVRSTPVQRVQQVFMIAETRNNGPAAALCQAILNAYRAYLELRSLPDADVAARLSDDSAEIFRQSAEFGDNMFRLLQTLGESSPLYRYVVA